MRHNIARGCAGVFGILVYVALGLPRAAGANNIIANGDFSSGTTSWTTSACGPNGGAPTPQALASIYHTAAPSAFVGSYTDMMDGLDRYSCLSQQVHIPRDVTQANFSCWLRFYSNQPATDPSMMGQAASVVINGSITLPLTSPFPINNSTAAFAQCTLDLKGYSDSDVQALFATHQDGFNSAVAIYVDDVVLDCITATPTYTRTVTRTATITPTCTISATVSPTPSITKTSTITPTITKTLTITPLVYAPGKAFVYPNPCSADTLNFTYSLAAPANIYIDVYNLMGFRVARLEDRNRPALFNQVTTWDVRQMAPGVYFYRMVVEGLDGKRTQMEMKKIVIAR